MPDSPLGRKLPLKPKLSPMNKGKKFTIVRKRPTYLLNTYSEYIKQMKAKNLMLNSAHKSKKKFDLAPRPFNLIFNKAKSYIHSRTKLKTPK